MTLEQIEKELVELIHDAAYGIAVDGVYGGFMPITNEEANERLADIMREIEYLIQEAKEQ